jgi:glutathione S-transferase
MGMKLYGSITTNVQRALLPILEAEVDIDDVLELEFVDLLKAEHKSPAYLAKQPFGQVPCLEDGDFVLYESRAIARYFAEKYQDQGVPLLGKSVKERAIINQWTEVESQTFNVAVGPMIRELFVSDVMKRPLNEAVIDAGLAKLLPAFDVYEAQLSKHKYIAGDEYSLADLFHIPTLNYLMTTLKTEVYGNHPRVLAWAENIISRPAVQKVVELNAKWLKQQSQ